VNEQICYDKNSRITENAPLAPSLPRLAAVFAVALCTVPILASAQVPPRFYWKTLLGSNGVPLLYQSLSGNTNPLDPAHVVAADVDFEAEVLIAGYAKMFSFFDRAAMFAVLQPMGRATGDVTVAGLGAGQRATGYGDPMVEFTISVLGPPPIKNVPDLLRYEPGFSLDLLVDLAFPIGEYDEEATVNLGQNRWFGRLGTPIVWQFGAWVPGRRTTLEFLPSVWFYGDNDDFAGTTLETDPKFQLEGHLTRDFTDVFWGSLDTNWMTGGKSTVGGHAGESLDSLGAGFTLGYPLSESIQLTVGYMASVNDSAPDDLRMDGLRISLVYGWHKIIAGMGRLGGGE
jgi:hypothetical protein